MRTKRKCRFSRNARELLLVFVILKGRIRTRWPLLPYHREPEAEGVLLLLDETIDNILDGTNIGDTRTGAVLGASHSFLASTSWPEQPNAWEEV